MKSQALSLALPVVAALVSLSPPALALDKRVEAAAKTALKKAAADYMNSNYEAAAARLKKAAAACGPTRCKPTTKAALLRDLGTMQFRNGDLGAAQGNWNAARKVDPAIALNPDYETADLRAAWGAGAGSDESVPSLPKGDFRHTPAAEQKVSTPLPIYVQYAGSAKIARVVVKYQSASMTGVKSFNLKRISEGWGGELPCDAVTRGTMRYWLQGFDDGSDIVASSGDAKHPFTVAIKDDIAIAAPHLPGQRPPSACGEDSDCPPGLAGCAKEAVAPEPQPVEPESPPAAAPPGFARFWFGIAGAVDFVSLPRQSDACQLNPSTGAPANASHYYCVNPDGSDFPLRTDGGTQNSNLINGASGHVDSGFRAGDVRVMLAFDYAVTPSLLLGARVGYVFNAYPGNAAVKEGRAFAPDLHLEARGTYLFGHSPLTRVGFAPMGFVGLGASEFDGHATTVVSLKNVAGQFPVNAWITDGPFFVTVGAGARYQFSPRAAFTGAVRANGAVGSNGMLITFGPEIGVLYGF